MEIVLLMAVSYIDFSGAGLCCCPAGLCSAAALLASAAACQSAPTLHSEHPLFKMGKKSQHKKPPLHMSLVHSPGNHFTCYRRTSLKPPLHRPGLLLLENHGRAVVGAPKINPELGKPPVSHGPPPFPSILLLENNRIQDYPH